ncbi:alpha/beta fold hydrolase [Alishewanella sp. d11]|uniref:alpha/beta fold hydrolase n=1 Tax=Alishewanella sp. d11 TaxID=3414030 RepID=UPI003BF86527
MSEREVFNFTSFDGQVLAVHQWLPVGECKGILQIVHGMAEHAARYNDLARFCQQQGFIVFADDHRGHGLTAKPQHLGHFAAGDHDNLVKDQHALTQFYRQRYPNCPIFLLGHSMGSFIVRSYLTRYGRLIDGAIICGTAGQQPLKSWFGKMLASWRLTRSTQPDPLLNTLVFHGYNRTFFEKLSVYDWLCSDKSVVQSYMADPYCAFIPTSGFFYELAVLVAQVSKTAAIKQVPADLPLFFIAGEQDPVGNYGKGVKQLARKFTALHKGPIQLRLYPEGRHEILNEVFKQEVYLDIITWLSVHCQVNNKV